MTCLDGQTWAPAVFRWTDLGSYWTVFRPSVQEFGYRILNLTQDTFAFKDLNIERMGDSKFSITGFLLELTRYPVKYVIVYYLLAGSRRNDMSLSDNSPGMILMVSWSSFLIPPTQYAAR